MSPTVTTCISCLNDRQVNDDLLCAHCAEWNDSIDGTLLALLQAESVKEDAE